MNTSNKLPYVLVGSAVGGAIGYLFMTKSGVEFRQSLMENGTAVIPEKLEGARGFIENKGRVVTDQVRGVLNRAKEAIEAGQEGYREAGRDYESTLRKIEGRNQEIVNNVHKTVDSLSQTAVTVQQSFMDPVYDMVAMVRGFERGIRRFIGRRGEVVNFGGGQSQSQNQLNVSDRDRVIGG